MPQAATIKCLPAAMRMMKAMQAQGIEWGDGYRRAAGDALKGILAGRMAAEIDRHLDEMAARGEVDRLPIVYPGIAIQRCWAHKIRNVLNKVRKADQSGVKADLHAIMNAANPASGPIRGRFANRWPGPLAPGRQMPATRSRRPAHLLAIQDPRSAQARANHQCHRATFPRRPAQNTAHGRLPGPDLHGSHPLRRLHTRKHKPGSPYPLLPDTEHLALPSTVVLGHFRPITPSRWRC